LQNLNEYDGDASCSLDKPATLMSHKNYDMEDIVNSPEFSHPELVKEMPISGDYNTNQYLVYFIIVIILLEFTLQYIHERGLVDPVLLKASPKDLEMRFIHFTNSLKSISIPIDIRLMYSNLLINIVHYFSTNISIFSMPEDGDNFSVNNVLEEVGERQIEVVEVSEQKGKSMKLSEFIKYYL